MNNIKYLALYFDAPLQSWGYASKFDRRTTLAYPTRSGVVGMLCAAHGVDRTDTIGLARINQVHLIVYVFCAGGRLTDYHTVGGGYDPKRDRRNICPKADDNAGDTVQTWREYLESSRFGVVVSGDVALVRDLAESVRNPKWGVWLGRKACVPAAQIFAGIHPDTDTAREALRKIAGVEAVLRTVRDAKDFADGNDTLMDMPLDFAQGQRKFVPRRVCVE